jgi:DNA invertase Pin-like site-specific DNA recombinase
MSAGDQDVSLQLDALRQAGCADDQIFLDVGSGTHTTRPGLEACLQDLAPGDTLIM